MPQMARQMPTMVVVPAGHPAPHDFLMLASMTTMHICGIFNLLSLGFGIPAIILAVMVTKAANSVMTY